MIRSVILVTDTRFWSSAHFTTTPTPPTAAPCRLRVAEAVNIVDLPILLKFLEVSHLSFVNNLGGKWKEGFVLKRSGGRRTGVIKSLQGLVRLLAAWSKRWLLVKDTFVAYVRPSDGVIADVVLMDRDFSIRIGRKDTGITNGLLISNLTRHLSLKCGTPNQTLQWQRSISEAASTTGSEFTTPNRFMSFAPERENSYVSWFQDAAAYMSAAADAMEAAREEIFITDWCLSPEVYMKRPHVEGNRWRLDKILERKAEDGVKIFIILFKEMEFAVGLNSYYSKQALTKLHQNIKVLRHPDGLSFWSHHEKCIVIDQRVAFLGGVDLCYGRWDTPSHKLTDLGSVMHNDNPSRNTTIQVDVHDDEHSSTECGDQDQRNISKDLWMQMIEPQRSYTSCLNLAQAAPMISVPRAASSETCLVTMSKTTPTVKPAPADSELVKKYSSYSSSKPPDGVAASSGHVSYVSENNNQSCGDSKGLHISPQATEISTIQIVIENMDDGTKTMTEHPLQLSGLENDAETVAEVQCGYCETVVNSRSVVASSDLCLKAPNGHEHGDDIPHTKQWSVCTESDHSHNVMNNNNQNKTDLSSKIPYIDSNSENEFQEFGRLPGDTEKSRYDSCNRTNTCHQTTNGTTCHCSAENSQSSEREMPIDPKVAEKFLELYARVKSRQTSPTQSGGEVNQDLLNSVSRQDRSVPCAHVTRYTKEEEHHCAKSCSQNNGTTDHNHEASQEQSTSGNTDSHSKHTNGWSSPGGYHCISLDLSNGVSGEDFKGPTSGQTTSDLNHSDELKQCSDLGNLRLSMLNKDTLEMPEKVQLRCHSDSWGRDKRMSLSTMSCFISEGKPLLLHNYLEVMGDGDQTDGQQEEDGGQGEDGKTMQEPMTEPPAVSSEQAILVSTTGNRKGFWRLKGKGISLDIKAAVSRAQKLEENPVIEAGIPYLNPATSTPKPTTPLPTRKPIFFQKARMIQHIKGKFIRSDKIVEGGCVIQDLLDNTCLFNEPLGPPSPGMALQEMGLEGDTKLWIGKDYANFIQKDFVDLDQPFTDNIDRRTTPRMPWHDISGVVYGKAARDVGRHFIQRWNFTKLQKRKTSADYPMLLPKSYRRVTFTENVTREAHCCHCQILRSASQWSAGISHVEDSIQQAYLQLICDAKHFIYIENQFFISTCDDPTENGIAEALYTRIIKAHSDNNVFRVYVVMPLLPAFEGELGTSSGAAIQVVMHWNYLSICRGGKSLLERLAAKIPDPFEYISFYGLRTHSELLGSLTTELIYVHSKLMIVDDTKVIFGSANINDRSLIGKRDSELAIVIEDKKMFPSRMNGQSCMVGHYASSLRKSLFREHLGLMSGKTPIDVCDPVRSDFYKGVWMKQAAINTSMYEKVFSCIPSDKIHNFHELHQQQKIEPLSHTCPTEAQRLLMKVKGHLVLLPLRFLCNENLQPAIGFGTKEALVPSVIWT
ncbi:Phospholipase D1 [Lamellibrachia satsuma]|nr:Phospholipase D1 [Lamellibrachia satsuma]